MVKKFFFMLWFFMSALAMSGADMINLRFSHITSDNGLTQNHVTCIMQDHKGLMWFGTKNGLCKYNGYEMKAYRHDTGNENSLPHNFIRAIYQDNQERIWIGTDMGICCYQPDTDDFFRYDISGSHAVDFAQNKDGLFFCISEILYLFNEDEKKFIPVENNHEKRIRGLTLAVDKNNVLWVGSASGLVGYNADFSQSNDVSIVKKDTPPTINDNVLTLFVDQQNHIWIGKNGNGVVCYDPETYNTTFYETGTGMPSGLVRAISQDVQGRMWFGTEKGISVLRRNNVLENIQQDYTNRFALNDNAVYDIEIDRKGNMWIGTYFGGVNVFFKDFEQFRYFNVGYGNKQLKGKAVRHIIEEDETTIWVATEDGGLNKFDKKNETFQKIESPYIKSDNIHSLTIDNSDNLWIGTFWGGLTRYNLKNRQYSHFDSKNSSLPDNNIFSLHLGKDGTVWIGTSSGLRYFNAKTNNFDTIQNELLSRRFIYCMYEDSKENLWVGLRAHGLVCYNKTHGVVRNWNAQQNKNQLTDNFITTIFEDSEKQIWVGTNNGGLYRYRSETDDFMSFLSEGILNEQCIYSLLEDDDKNIWITTNNGLFRYNRTMTGMDKYTREEGLPTNHFNYASAMKTKNGDFYLGTVNGMIAFNPETIQQKIDFPNIIFTGLSIGEKTITPNTKNSPLKNDIDNTSKIVLNHKQAQFFGIEYAGINLGHINNIMYAIQMEGLNSEWQYVNSQRSIVFSRLSAGKYIFSVKASSSKNNWDNSNIRSIEIVVKPPFYLSVWAMLIYILLAIVIIYFIFRFYYNRLKEKNAIRVNELEKQKLEEMNELKRSFFTNISHEFKTPLTLIIAPIQHMLNENNMPEKIKKTLELVLKNSNSLMNLVKELIEFNRTESNQAQLKLQKGNPLSFIQEICNRFQVLAYEDEINFTVEMEDMDEEVWFGLPTVEKITNNLLSNAFKYTLKGGSVKLQAAIVEGDDDQLFLKIIVSDTGIGIADENKEKIFQSYYQAEQQNAAKRPGWGIGLALTKNLTTLHKGNISLESEVGKGSVFTVCLNVSDKAFPLENRLELRADRHYYEKYNYSNIVSEEQLRSVNKNDASLAEKKNDILLVEDEVEMLNFQISLFAEKYDVRVAKNGVEALRLMEEKLPDLLISDIMMPEMDGMELCGNIKSNLMTSHIPVILLTAKNDTSDIIKGYELGADVYIEKPFNPSSLLLQVQNLLRTRDNNRKQFKESIASNIKVIARNKHDEKLLNDIKKVVEDNISNEEFSVSDVIKTVGISRTMLHVKLKSMLDMSIGDYIRNIRIEKAKELLEQGEAIADTAYATGFSDPNYFSKCFKKQIGKTPSEYIKEKNL